MTAPEENIQVIVPIYNEGENVKLLVSEFYREKVPFSSLKFVYDFDEDTTLPFIAELKANDERLFAEKNEYGRGVINALRWGFSHAQAGPVIVVMGDLSDKLSIIPEMIQLWREGATIVSPSRYMKGGEQHGGGIIKTFLSSTAGRSLKLFGFPTADATNNFKLYDGLWLSEQKIESLGGFEVAIELCYKAFSQKRKIVEIPTVWRDRTQGESNFKLVDWLPHYLKWYFKILGTILRRHA